MKARFSLFRPYADHRGGNYPIQEKDVDTNLRTGDKIELWGLDLEVYQVEHVVDNNMCDIVLGP